MFGAFLEEHARAVIGEHRSDLPSQQLDDVIATCGSAYLSACLDSLGPVPSKSGLPVGPTALSWVAI